MLPPEIISELKTIRAHAMATMQMADQLIKKSEDPNQKKSRKHRGLTVEEMAELDAHRRKRYIK